MSMIRLAPILILALGGGIIAWGLWNRSQHPTRVVATGRIEIDDRVNGRKLLLATRTLENGGVRREEVQLPGGTWIDCGGDCREAVRKEYLEFWDEQRRRGG